MENADTVEILFQRKSRRVRGMYFAAAVVLLGVLGMGAVISYSAVAVPDMQRYSSRVHDLMDVNVTTWFTGLMAIGALFGGLVAGALSDGIGRRSSLLVTVIPFTAGWLLICYSDGLPSLFIGRILTGSCCGMLCVTAPMYLVEISTPEIRGLLGSCFQVSVVTGALMAASVGSVLRWSWLTVVCSVPPVIMGIGLLFVPESPRWLVSKGRYQEAYESIEYLHCNKVNPSTEIDSFVKNLDAQPKGRVTMHEMLRPVSWKSFMLSMGLMVFQQCSGINAIMMYSVHIFQNAGSTIDPNVATVIINFIQVLMTIVGMLLVDRAGRRVLLLISGVGMFVGLFGFGLFDYLKLVYVQVSSYGWFPMLSLVVCVASFAIGYGPIPWMMIPEMVPLRIVGLVSGVATAFNWLCVFFVTKFYLSMEDKLEMYGLNFLYSGVALVSCIFTYLFLPETKNKSLEEVQDLLYPREEREPLISDGQNTDPEGDF